MTTGYEERPGCVAIQGVGVGCVTDAVKGTGVTVIYLPEGSVGAVDISGGAPATRETALLDPMNLVLGPDAIVLCGGSAMGLEAADGAARALREDNRGVSVGRIRVPIVVAAAIFDMDYRQNEAPAIEDGYLALKMSKTARQDVPEGSQGAGTGATVGKVMGPEKAMKGGQGAVTLVTPDGLRVGAVVVVNAVGSVIDEQGTVLAGPCGADDRPLDTTVLWSLAPIPLAPGSATTVGAVITNARLSKAELARVARMGHDGLARAIDPVHTPWDGDTLFAISVGDLAQDAGRVGAIAARAVAVAIRRAIRAV